ncbi:hypothetical protein NXS19_011108 [Fusarium pseudograminearum]|nr:hypothetical protein NXS19_011108 [Fusarium pseudograminearum]
MLLSSTSTVFMTLPTIPKPRWRSKTMLFSNLSAISLLFQGLPGVYSKPTCTVETFRSIKLDNAEIISINANVSSIELPEWPTNEWPIPAGSPPINVCKVVVTYTHPGWNDTINAYVWLPVSDWNERFVGVGGGAGQPEMFSILDYQPPTDMPL